MAGIRPLATAASILAHPHQGRLICGLHPHGRPLNLLPLPYEFDPEVVAPAGTRGQALVAGVDDQ